MEDGKFIVNENAPVFMHKLANLYNFAKAKFPNEYYTSNIHEFVAGSFVSDEFRELLDNTQHNGKSLFDAFKDAIAAMVRYITNSKYSDEVVNTVYELLATQDYTSEVNVATNALEQMKIKDAAIDLQIAQTQPVQRPTVDYGINNIKNLKQYTKETSDSIIEKFKAGEEFIITPTAKRAGKEVEIKYMNDLINYVKTTLTPGENILDAVIIDNIDAYAQTLRKRPNLLDGLASGLFSTGGDTYSSKEFRLPEIKKCK